MQSQTRQDPSFRALTQRPLALNRAYLDHKLMDFPDDLATKALLLENARYLRGQFVEQYLVIWASK